MAQGFFPLGTCAASRQPSLATIGFDQYSSRCLLDFAMRVERNIAAAEAIKAGIADKFAHYGAE